MSDIIPGTASSLLIHGKIFSHTNLTGDGTPNLHPAVQEFFQQLPTEQREHFIGYCAESALVSDQLWALEPERADRHNISLDDAVPHFSGAAMVSKKIRDYGDPEHGQPTEPCGACKALLNRLNIQFIGP
ncbi:YwqJ-related putative deaminase [Streptomyces sp. cg2]|uniref:YwqJ-related putative deaminase n=1 Tax=Streptomyces sp. cg2 TaxID=3238799 RepID=UPI0034E1EA09